MKRIYSFLLVVLLLVGAFSTRAQTIGSSSLLTGTNYFPVLISTGVYQTNQVFQSGAYKTVTLGNIASTNETATVLYAFNPTNGLTPAPGLPGYFLAGSTSNSFAAGTNGGSFSFTFNGSGVTIYSPLLIGVALSGTNLTGTPVTNSVYVP